MMTINMNDLFFVFDILFYILNLQFKNKQSIKFIPVYVLLHYEFHFINFILLNICVFL